MYMLGGKHYYIYILASQKNGTLYIGVTRNLLNRTYQHKNSHYEESFTDKYAVHKLVYYEVFGNIHMALQREKRLKKWNREWKVNLIERFNPGWKDLFPELLEA